MIRLLTRDINDLQESIGAGNLHLTENAIERANCFALGTMIRDEEEQLDFERLLDRPSCRKGWFRQLLAENMDVSIITLNEMAKFEPDPGEFIDLINSGISLYVTRCERVDNDTIAITGINDPEKETEVLVVLRRGEFTIQ